MLTIVENRFNLIHMRSSARNTIDTLNLQTKQINGLNTLINNHRDRRTISLEKLLQIHPKHRLERGEVNWIHSRRRSLLLLSVLLLLLRRRRLLRRRILLQRMRLWSRVLERQSLQLWRASGAVGRCGAVAHAVGVAGLGAALAVAPLVLLVLLRLLLLLLGGRWWTALVET